MRSIETICATAGTDVPYTTWPLTAPVYRNSVVEIERPRGVDELVADVEQALARA